MQYRINTKQDVMDLIDYYGFLPFFENEIEGFSIAEMCNPKIYFTELEGPWDWKGPIISEMQCAYGKFFQKKAGFVSRKWFNDFANYRRDGYDFDARFEDGLASYNDQFLYDIVASRNSVLSKEAKAIGGYVKPKEKGKDAWEPRKGFDTTITRLQMQCYVITSNFEYELGKDGKPYGWGIAKYAIPEKYLGKQFEKHVYDREPLESKKRILRHLKKVLPDVSDNLLEYLIG